MKLGMFGLSVTLLAFLAPPTFAGQGTPFSPPPASGVETPYNADRDAPASYPSASVSWTAGCTPVDGRNTIVNGASVPAAQPGSRTATQASATHVVLANGASIPTAGGPSDETWCGGAYRDDWGTNFGGR